MKARSPLSNVPELRDLADAERYQVIKQWQREVNRSWSGYLLYVGFIVVGGALITCVPIILFVRFLPPAVRTWVVPALVPVGLMFANTLYQRVMLTRYRGILSRILQQRRNAP